MIFSDFVWIGFWIALGFVLVSILLYAVFFGIALIITGLGWLFNKLVGKEN